MVDKNHIGLTNKLLIIDLDCIKEEYIKEKQFDLIMWTGIKHNPNRSKSQPILGNFLSFCLHNVATLAPRQRVAEFI